MAAAAAMPSALLRQRLALFAAALWWGSGAGMGLVAAPLMFQILPDARLAGAAATHIFMAQGWLGVACAALLLLVRLPAAGPQATPQAAAQRPPQPDLPDLSLIACASLGMLLALLIEFAVAPRIAARHDPAFWHKLGAAVYIAQWLCAAFALWRAAAHPAASRPIAR